MVWKSNMLCNTCMLPDRQASYVAFNTAQVPSAVAHSQPARADAHARFRSLTQSIPDTDIGPYAAIGYVALVRINR
jgi:hypothetical protein